MKDISVYQFVREFNRSAFRSSSIPMDLASGWPCITLREKTLCIIIPYFYRERRQKDYALYPISCSAMVPLGNPDRILDFTMYQYQDSWQDVDFTSPAGYFKHEALAGVTKQEYKEMVTQLYAYYDELIRAVKEERTFEEQPQMRELFSRLMEPGHYPQYLKINGKFYSCFCGPAPR